MAKRSGLNLLIRTPDSRSNSCARSSGRNTRRNLPGLPIRNWLARPAGQTAETLKMIQKSILAKAWLHLLLVGTLNLSAADQPAERVLPVRGFCISSPSGNRVDEFIKFTEEELVPRSVNVLILRVDYG